MRQSQKEALLAQTHEISAQVSAAVKYTASKDSLAVQFCLGMVTAYLNRLEADIVNTETDPDEDGYPELSSSAAVRDLYPESEGWKEVEVQDASEDETAAAGAGQETEDAEDVVLHGPEKEEQPAAGAKARVKMLNLPEASTLPPTKEVRVPDEELPKPKRRGRQPKTLVLDEDLPDPLE